MFEGLVRYLTFRTRRHGRDYARLGFVLNHPLEQGGHLSAQAMGALYNYVSLDRETREPCVAALPVREDYPYAVDAKRLADLIQKFLLDVIIIKEPATCSGISVERSSRPMLQAPAAFPGLMPSAISAVPIVTMFMT